MSQKIKENNKKLIFGNGNQKLPFYITTFSLPAAWSCPQAFHCQTFANPVTGKLIDGKNQIFRCYAASQENYLKTVRKARWHNFKLLKACNSTQEIVNLIENSLPESIVVRCHPSGDFFSQNYFDAWLQVAKNHPFVTFYAYTKSLDFWLKRAKEIPKNFKFNASLGGKLDNLAIKHKLKTVKVVYSESEAIKNKLEIDHDDSHAYRQSKSFALLLHGNGPVGSLQAKIHHSKVKNSQI